ncbi:MAG: 4-hydroxythreonine-4-phosphate dehydrogenase PdxA [Phycisphaerales bacterium]|jgi:4-hydroxythreonine-4-phosphate dehydrogenase
MDLRIAISMGDPGGIGPEVIVKALADESRRARAGWITVGSRAALDRAAHDAGWHPAWRSESWERDNNTPRAGEIVVLDDGTNNWRPEVSRDNGEASFQYVERAIALAQREAADPWHAHAVVTGPISKQAWALAGHTKYPGHTELFAERFGVRDFAMMFMSDVMNVILATVHVPLARVPGLLTTAGVLRAITLGAAGLEARGFLKPRIAVCGLNPHAGEHGLLGTEDDWIIAPAIAQAAALGLNVAGPFPGDTVFLDAIDRASRPRRFDLVVAMYHDQGLIPFKLLARDSGVNVTVGLPTVRTSPDHGTAFDIAGKNVADAGSMAAACDLAIEMAGARLR